MRETLDKCYPPAQRYGIIGTVQLQAFIDMPREEKAKLSLVQGHFNYGVHQLMPQPCEYITVLREPADRLISYYYYVHRIGPDHYMYDRIVGAGMTLEEFAGTKLNAEFDNHQTRMLAGDLDHIPPGQLQRQHLRMAKRNLKTFALVGVQDCFDAFLQTVIERYGQGDIEVKPANISKDRPRVDQISPTARAKLLANNHFDQELYLYARRLAVGVPRPWRIDTALKGFLSSKLSSMRKRTSSQ